MLINVLFGLFYYINSLVNKDKKIVPLIISNLVIIVLLYITIVAWNCGWVEARDDRIHLRPDEPMIEELQNNTEDTDIENKKTTSPD